MKRHVVMALFVIELLVSSAACAQANACYTPVESCDYQDPSGPPGSIVVIPPEPPMAVCNTDKPGCAVCNPRNYSCRPPNGANEVCLTCNAGRTAQAAPIDLATGNVYVTQSDISVPGLGGGLGLSRSWNSLMPSVQNSFPSMFGPNWRSNYEERIITNSGDGYVKYARGDGSVWSYGYASSANTTLTYKPAAPANDMSTLTLGKTSHTLVFKNGEQRAFDATTGVLTSIIDRNGNATQLTYDSSNRLATVSDAAGRHLYFSYASPSSNLVTSVTSDVGITMLYSYDTQGRLSKLTKPDQTTVSFSYDGQSRITAVSDSEGKILESHTYDALGRGLSSSRANGVGSVSVSYPQ